MLVEDKAIISTFAEVIKSFGFDNEIHLDLENDPDARVCLTGINEIFYNSIYIKNPINEKKLIEELESIRSQIQKPLTVWITAETQVPEFEILLKQKFESPGPFFGMLLDLETAHLTPCNTKITIEKIVNANQAENFGSMFSEIFHLPNMQKPMTDWVINQYESNEPICINYMAKLDGESAGICSLAIDKQFSGFKAGGFYNAGVLPEYRNAGVGTAMANHRVTAAKNLELESLSIVLMSNAMARGYCERLGFINYKTMTPYYIR